MDPLQVDHFEALLPRLLIIHKHSIRDMVLHFCHDYVIGVYNVPPVCKALLTL